MKIYIAGKISGNENYQEDFRKAQERLHENLFCDDRRC